MPEDAYSKFLGLPEGQRPPGPHVLLGVEADTNDPEIIEAAALRRMDALDQYALSSDRATREQVQQLMNEIAKARVRMMERTKPRQQPAPPAATPEPAEETAPAAAAPVQVAETKPSEPAAKPEPEPEPKPKPAPRPMIWPRLSVEAWSLMGVAWLASLVVTGAAAYFIASGLEPASAPPPAGPLATNNPPADPLDDPQDDPADTDPPTPTPDPVEVDDPPVDPDPDPDPQPDPDPDPGPETFAVHGVDFADLETLAPREIVDRVMSIADTTKRREAFVLVRDRLADQPDKQLQLIEQGLMAFNGMDRISFSGRPYADGRFWVSLTPEDASNPQSSPNVNIRDLSPLQGLKMTSLLLYELSGLTDFAPLATIQAEYLRLDGCVHFEDVSLLNSIKGLKVVSLDRTGVSDLTPLDIGELATLSLKQCKELRSISGLQNMRIDTLDLTDSSEISYFVPLRSMRIGRSLNLSGTAFRDLSLLADQPLSELILNRCPGLGSLDGLEQLPELQLLYLKETHLLPSDVDRAIGRLPGVTVNRSYAKSTIPLKVKKWEELAKIENAALRHESFIQLRDSLTPFSEGQAELIRKELKLLNGTDVELRMWRHQADEPKLSVGSSSFQEKGPNHDIKDLSPLTGLKATFFSMRYLPNVRDFSFLKGSTIRRLDLSGCKQFSDVRVLNEINGLEELIIGGTAVSDLEPLQLKTLKTLSLENNTRLTSLDGLDGMTITSLSVSGCERLRDTNALRSVRGLKHVNLSKTGISHIVPLMSQKDLEFLYLSNCEELRSIEMLGRLSNLRTLAVDGLTRVPFEEFTNLKQALPDTQVIDWQRAGADQDNNPPPPRPDPVDPPDPVEEPDDRPVLSFERIKQIEIPSVRNNEFVRLRDSLKPYSTEQAALIREAMREFNGSRGLNIKITPNKERTAYTVESGFKGRAEFRSPLSAVRDISMLRGLTFEKLDLSGCISIRDFSVLGTVWAKELNLNYCLSLDDFDAINKVEGLESLDISNTSIEDFEEMTIDKLDTLTIQTCRELDSLDGLEGKSIRFLKAGENMRITDYTALPQIKDLKWLDLNTTAISSSTDLRGLELEQLDLSRCRNLTELAGLWDMQTLRKLDISGSTQIDDRYAEALRRQIDGLRISE